MRAREAAMLRAKAGYAAALRALAPRLGRGGPPPRAHRLRHWLYTLPRIHDAGAMAELDVPWWTYRAIDAIEAWLAARPGPARVFEYGAGASTLWLARRAAEVWSVEHDRAFADSIAERVAAAGNVHLRVAEPVRSDRPVVASAKEGYGGLDFAGYVAAIDDAAGAFDLVVVDGRARPACLARALPRLRSDGLIVFDNSRRARYRAAIESCGLPELRLRGLTPALPYPEQTSLLTATPLSAPRRPPR